MDEQVSFYPVQSFQCDNLIDLVIKYAIATICDQESFAMNKEFELRIAVSVADIPCSRSPAKLSTGAEVFIDQEMRKDG